MVENVVNEKGVFTYSANIASVAASWVEMTGLRMDPCGTPHVTSLKYSLCMRTP